MKKGLLIFLVFLSGYCSGQEYMAGKLSEFRVDEETKDTIIRSYWQVMERGSLIHKLNTFYRISSINGKLFLDIKAIEGGDVFVVPRDAAFRLILENGDVIILYNKKYEVSCAGCGDRGYWGGQGQGVSLTFPLPKEDIRLLLRYYVVAIAISDGDGYLEKKVTPTHSDLFLSELRHVYRKRY